MIEEKRKSRVQMSAIAVFFIIVVANYMRHPHEGIRAVDFVQILAIGMLLGILLLRSIQIFKGN